MAGMGESRLNAIVAQLQNNLTSLNAALTGDSLTPVATITSSMVLACDPMILPDAWPLMLCVVSGGRSNNLVRDNVAQVAMTGLYRNLVFRIGTNINVYIHPNAVAVSDPITQATSRALLVERVCDWLWQSVFCSHTGSQVLSLTSQFNATGSDVDRLVDGMITELTVDTATKDCGGAMTVVSIHARHEGTIQ